MLNDALLPQRIDLALVCSVSCPGGVIIRTYDAIRELRDAGVIVAGGFHSPMERECLAFLIRGTQPVVWILARGLNCLDATDDEWRAIRDRRLIVGSIAEPEIEHATPATAIERNELVVDLATTLFVPHASPGGKTEALVGRLLRGDARVVTFDDPSNANLISAGASTDLSPWLGAPISRDPVLSSARGSRNGA